MRRTVSCGLIMMAAAAILLPACSKQGTGGSTGVKGGGSKIKVAFVSNNTEEFWTIAEAGTRKAAEEEGCTVLFRRPKSPTPAAQQEIIEDLLAQGAQAIAISVNAPDNQTDFLNKIAEQVPLITQDNDAPGTKRKLYLGTDNYKAGRDAGKMVKEVQPEGGTVVIFVGQSDAMNAKERRQGVIEELAGLQERAKLVEHSDGKKYGNYQVHSTKYDNADRGKAKDNAADMLTLLTNEKNLCFVGLWAYNPPAILGAVEEAKKLGQVKIVGFDEDDATLNGIKAGHIHGTVVQQPFEFGKQSVKWMVKLVRDPATALPPNGIDHVPHLIIKKDNAEDFHQRLKAMLGK